MTEELLTPDYIFEASWEVCNKVGGIYTVLSTRAKTLQEKLRNRLARKRESYFPRITNSVFCVA